MTRTETISALIEHEFGRAVESVKMQADGVHVEVVAFTRKELKETAAYLNKRLGLARGSRVKVSRETSGERVLIIPA